MIDHVACSCPYICADLSAHRVSLRVGANRLSTVPSRAYKVDALSLGYVVT